MIIRIIHMTDKIKNFKRMNRFFFFGTFLFFLSCNDGNLDIASFEFEETVNRCGDTNITLYRLSTDGQKEALIITLTDQEIRMDENEVPPIRVSENGDFTVTDRVFDKEVTSKYFCAVVPPVKPKVLKNWAGESGTIFVTNEPVFEEGNANVIAWKHTIVLNDVVLKSGSESLIFNDIFLFGIFETPVN